MRHFITGLVLTASIFASTAVFAGDERGFKESFLLPGGSRWYTSNGWVNGDHQACEWRADAIKIAGKNLRMTLSDRGGAKRPIGCAEIHTTAKLGYGLYEARMRSAAGSGLNSNFFTYIGPENGKTGHDEIDFEFLGKDPKTVQLNYFNNGQGKHEKIIQLGFDASQSFHNYAFEWSADKIRWYVDGNMVFETPDGAPQPPTNPGNMFFSLWAGTKMEDAWLGPFEYKAPVTADVEWAAFTPAGEKCKFPESLSCKK